MDAMEGVVAEARALGERFLSGVEPTTWLSRFRRNGFT
jgi:hypothetical protein